MTCIFDPKIHSVSTHNNNSGTHSRHSSTEIYKLHFNNRFRKDAVHFHLINFKCCSLSSASLLGRSISLRPAVFFAAMGKAGGGRNEVDPRFISKFAVINLQFPLESTLKHIYGSILKGHLLPFSENVQAAANVVVQMTLDLFNIVTAELPPTPAKHHYIFNLKDLSKTYAGILQIQPGNFKEPRQLVRVWRNEFTRVFCDRMICDEDLNVIHERMSELVNKNFKDTRIRPSTISFRAEKADKKDSIFDMPASQYIMRDPLLFGDFRHGVVDEEERIYEDLLDFTAVMHLYTEIMDEFNEVKGKLSLVLFDDCLDHLTRVHRTLRMHK